MINKEFHGVISCFRCGAIVTVEDRENRKCPYCPNKDEWLIREDKYDSDD